MATRSTLNENGLTSAIAGFVSGCGAGEVPNACHDQARRAIVDTVGVLLAGRGEAPVAMLGTAIGDGDEAISLAFGRSVQSRDAALADSLAGHVLDYDDVARHGHPSVVIVPALLAQAQKLGVSGAAVIEACAIGQEVWAELARREPGAYHMGSWHPTPVLGVVAATGALCRLAGLDAQTSRNALGLAASFSGGLIASFGTHAKPLQTGRAAASAIEACELAQAGLTAAGTALEDAHGLLPGISPGGAVALDEPLQVETGNWQSLAEGLSVKRYPVCYASHRAIDALIGILDREAIAPESVAAITASIGPAPAATVDNPAPATGIEARFSLQHNLAAALVERAVGFAQLDDAFVRDPRITRFYELNRIETVAGDCPDQPGMARHDRVEVTLQDGRRLDSGPIRYPKGHARLPLDDAQLAAKFRDCARHGGIADPGPLLDSLLHLDEIADMRSECEKW